MKIVQVDASNGLPIAIAAHTIIWILNIEQRGYAVVIPGESSTKLIIPRYDSFVNRLYWIFDHLFVLRFSNSCKHKNKNIQRGISKLMTSVYDKDIHVG